MIELRGITKRFGRVLANDHINITVDPGTIHAIVGENGAGKSTAMRIAYGFYAADSGEILVDGQVRRISRPQDAISLWHLLQRVDSTLRGAVYDRLAALVPPPPGVTRRGAIGLQSRDLEGYWTKIQRIHFRIMVLGGHRDIDPRTGLSR